MKRNNERAVMVSERREGLDPGSLIMNNHVEQSKVGTRPTWEEEMTQNGGEGLKLSVCECVSELRLCVVGSVSSTRSSIESPVCPFFPN